MVSMNDSVKIKFKFILFKELKKSFMAPLKSPPGVLLCSPQSKARMAERKAESRKQEGVGSKTTGFELALVCFSLDLIENAL